MSCSVFVCRPSRCGHDLKWLSHVTGTLPEFERDLIRERTLAGLAAARARGKRGGRPKALDAQHIGLAKTLYDSKQLPVKEICALLAIGKTTFYRYLHQIEAP